MSFHHQHLMFLFSWSPAPWESWFQLSLLTRASLCCEPIKKEKKKKGIQSKFWSSRVCFLLFCLSRISLHRPLWKANLSQIRMSRRVETKQKVIQTFRWLRHKRTEVVLAKFSRQLLSIFLQQCLWQARAQVLMGEVFHAWTWLSHLRTSPRAPSTRWHR